MQPTGCIKGKYRSAARRQGGTASGNYVSQATRPSPISHTRVVLIDIHSTADEAPAVLPTWAVYSDYHDPLNAPPFASVNVSYRPRGTRIFLNFPETQLILLLELLIAEGVITGVGAKIGGGSEASERKRTASEDDSPGPSTKRRTRSTVKKEIMSVNTPAQRIQTPQVSRVN
jgi:hypothetical protein